MWKPSQLSCYILIFILTLILCSIPSYIDGSLLEGGDPNHHHHDHEHDHHNSNHGDENSDHNMHAHNEQHQINNKTSTSISPVFNFLGKVQKPAKEKLKKSKGRRKGRKFSNTGKRKEKKFSRPFPFRIPRTSFSCRDRAPGYYADMEADCQVYRMCTARGGGQAFLCPEGTRFNQRTLVCDHKHRVTCSDSSNFFHRNLIMHEESMMATKKSRTRNKALGRSKELRKRPRLQSTEILNKNSRPRPNVIRTGRLNGRLRFAPLFERRRKENFEKFAKALDMKSHEKNKTPSRPKLNRFGSLPSKDKKNTSSRKLSKTGSLPSKDNNKTSRKNESKNIKSKQFFKETQKNNGRRNHNRDEDNLLGLPELPPDIPRNSPIFTFKTGPKGPFSFSSIKDRHHLKDGSEENDIKEEVETIGGQLLPPVAAGKSVAKFRKDREGSINTNNQLAVFLTPPPPFPKVDSKPPLQLVGHVMTSNELSAFPDSPIVNIKQLTSSDKQIKNTSDHPNSSIEEKNKKDKLGKKRPRNGRLTSRQRFGTKIEKNKKRFRGNSHEEKARSSGRGNGVGLPIQLRPSGRGMPAPLVWISPASLARSPMVSLRMLGSPNHNELFKSGNVERTLTMTFPGRSTGRFNPSCLECMSIKQNSGECPPCFLVVR